MREDDFDRGLAQRRSVLGHEWVEKATAGATAFTAQWQEFITRTAWHAVWGHEGLDTETRRLLAMTSMLALGRWEEFEMHVHAALKSGMPESSLQDMLRLAAVYCGVPAANNGFRIAAQALAAQGRPSPPQPLTPEWRERSFQTFSQPQTQLRVQGPETGRPVVLCHALGLDLTMWTGLARHLAAQGHAVLRYDLQGHGASLMGDAVGIDALVEDAARVVQEWGRGPVVFVGLSLGGMVAQGLAIRHPQLVSALVLANTAAGYPEAAREAFKSRAAQVRRSGLAGVIDEVLPRYLSSAFMQREPEAAAALRAQLLRCPSAGYAACCEALATVDWHDSLDHIRVPTWVVSGAHDHASPTALQQALVQGIRDAQHSVLPCAHLPTLEAPVEFMQHLDRFLAHAMGLDR